jgi:hypothetical protein
MTITQTVTMIEDRACQIERARAVLNEVANYFEDVNNHPLLPVYADHITLLLHVVLGLLAPTGSELQKAVDALITLSRANQEAAT